MFNYRSSSRSNLLVILRGMWPSRRNTPVQLGTIAVRGMVLYTLTLSVAALLSYLGVSWLHTLHIGPRFFRGLVALAVFVPSLVIELRAILLLREGIRLERWSEEDLDALRTKVDRPVWTFVGWSLFVLMVLLIVLLPLGSGFSSVWLFVWMPISLISNLQSALRKPISPERKTIDWSTAKPLQSDHWGGKA